MPQALDILFERLKHFDEVTLLELLDITSEDILARFKSRVISKKEFLFGEVELFDIDDPEVTELDNDEYGDGFQIEERDSDDD